MERPKHCVGYFAYLKKQFLEGVFVCALMLLTGLTTIVAVITTALENLISHSIALGGFSIFFLSFGAFLIYHSVLLHKLLKIWNDIPEEDIRKAFDEKRRDDGLS